MSFLTLVQGSLEKLSVSEISMSSPYRTPVRSFLTCGQRQIKSSGRLLPGRAHSSGLVKLGSDFLHSTKRKKGAPPCDTRT